MNKYEKTLKLFTGYDQYREWTQEPHLQNGYIYASDTRIAIQIDKQLVEYDYPELEKPDLATPFKVNKELDMQMTIEDMENVYDRVPYTTIERCEACEGRGVVDFEFEYGGRTYLKSDECPVCCGEGVVSSINSKRDFRYSILVHDSCLPIKQKYFGILMSAMKALEVDTIRLAGCSACVCLFDVCEGVKIAVGVYRDEPDSEYVLKYKEGTE